MFLRWFGIFVVQKRCKDVVAVLQFFQFCGSIALQCANVHTSVLLIGTLWIYIVWSHSLLGECVGKTWLSQEDDKVLTPSDIRLCHMLWRHQDETSPSHNTCWCSLSKLVWHLLWSICALRNVTLIIFSFLYQQLFLYNSEDQTIKCVFW